jgi:Flp pilus assembly protein TadD
MRESMEGQGLSDRGLAHRAAGDLESAWLDVSRAASLDPESARVRFNLGVVAESRGDAAAAEEAYLAALGLRPPGRFEAAANLASLWIRQGDPGRAVAPLRRMLGEDPSHPLCWNQLVVALFESGERFAALEATEEAALHGVDLDPELVAAVRAGALAGGDPR